MSPHRTPSESSGNRRPSGKPSLCADRIRPLRLLGVRDLVRPERAQRAVYQLSRLQGIQNGTLNLRAVHGVLRGCGPRSLGLGFVVLRCAVCLQEAETASLHLAHRGTSRSTVTCAGVLRHCSVRGRRHACEDREEESWESARHARKEGERPPQRRTWEGEG
eukprot:CAMPEP_0115381958 /NCGR_PEP_ID=MMETSP0271-20121206/5839_1 /TAXON_ID=71861 /ORGANISM="Scrippsiella trochoidea, Strain CCMP3099" /LENGTH=161 /DNA_ID=CAMNT_0002805255 /DNA_START=194 /DNA_END=676 /DNA_ORIENTATION=-